MIYFLMHKSGSFTIHNYKNYRGKKIAERIKIVEYHKLEKLNNARLTTLVFSDHDRLSTKQLETLSELANSIQKKYPTIQMLNHPAKVLRRYDLLKTLHKNGQNSFNVFRINESWQMIKYPVFLREENNHNGALTSLIYNEKQLRRNIVAKLLLGYSIHELLIMEFCDVKNNDGVRNKYALVRLCSKIIPRYFELSKKWMLKTDLKLTDKPVSEILQNYWQFMHENPHKEWGRAVFELAGIDYGRIDYALKDGEKQVWEINVNPAYDSRNRDYHPEIDKLFKFSHEIMMEEFLRLDSIDPIKIQFDNPEELAMRLKTNWVDEKLRWFHNHFKTKKKVFKWCVEVLFTLSYGLAYILIMLPKFRKIGRKP